MVLAHIARRVPPSQREGHAVPLGLRRPKHHLVLANLGNRLKRGYTILKHKEDRSLTEEDGMGL